MAKKEVLDIREMEAFLCSGFIGFEGLRFEVYDSGFGGYRGLCFIFYSSGFSMYIHFRCSGCLGSPLFKVLRSGFGV